MLNVQSTVTPISALKTKPNGKAKHTAMASTAMTRMTREQAITIARDYGTSLAGLDGELTKALQAFKGDEAVRAEMLEAVNVGYMARKLGYDLAEAARIVGLKKYNEKKQDDEHRTFDQQRVMDTVRVLWHHANKNAGTLEKPIDQAKAEAKRAEREAERKAHEARLIKADKIVNPPDDVDVFDSLNQLVLTMKAIQKKHKLTGDRGSEWRDWLANAPR